MGFLLLLDLVNWKRKFLHVSQNSSLPVPSIKTEAFQVPKITGDTTFSTEDREMKKIEKFLI